MSKDFENGTEERSVTSFEINEDFSELKEKLTRSIKDGLISQLATNDSYFDSVHKEDLYIHTYTEEDYWHDFDRGITTEGKFIRLDEDKISLGYYETWSLGVDTFGNDVSDDDNDRAVTIQSKENGGCIVSGDIEILENLKEFRDIFAGVRNEITYVPGTLNKGNENKLLEDEKYKINGLQEYKNLFNSKYEHKVEFDTDKVLSIIDPSGYTVAGDINVAVHGSAEMAGPRRDVNFCHQKMNYGLDNESESLSFSDGEYPENCYRGVTEHEGTWTDWGYETTIPEHWSRFDADTYFNMRFEGHPVSERVFDSYLKSSEKNFDVFLKTVVRQFLKNKNNGKSQKESLDAALTFIDSKNRVRQSIEQNKAMTADIKEGMAKTKESGYKHISRTPAPKKGGRED